MSESIPQHSPSLYWLPKINHDLYDNIDKIMRNTIDRDPLLFIPRPTWKVYSADEGTDDFMLINVSNIHQINIYLIYKYEMNYSIVDHIDIQENWYVKGQPYSRRVAIVKSCNYMVTWIDNVYTQNYPSETEMSINRVTDALIKLGLAECRNTQ